ncbi:MAG: fluoride efflux transporter CrcB [Phycisphaerales bacterium]|nr:fluoride efflux transporter CrcB [Phycisphaerales bacterium]
MTVLWLALAGVAGTLARYGVQVVAKPWGLGATDGRGFPVATLTVNLAGCLLFGVLWAAGSGRAMSDQTRLAVLVGFLGAFTTFSSFAFETVFLLERGRTGAAVANVIANNLGGLALCAGGIWLARTFLAGDPAEA